MQSLKKIYQLDSDVPKISQMDIDTEWPTPKSKRPRRKPKTHTKLIENPVADEQTVITAASQAVCMPGILYSDVVQGTTTHTTQNPNSIENKFKTKIFDVDDVLLSPYAYCSKPQYTKRSGAGDELTYQKFCSSSSSESIRPSTPTPKLSPPRQLPRMAGKSKSKREMPRPKVSKGLTYAAAAASANKCVKAIVSPRLNHRGLGKNVTPNDDDTPKFEVLKNLRGVTMTDDLNNKPTTIENVDESPIETPTDSDTAEVKGKFPTFTDSDSYLAFHLKRLELMRAEQEGSMGHKLDPVDAMGMSAPAFTPFVVARFDDENFLEKERQSLSSLTDAILDNIIYVDKVIY